MALTLFSGDALSQGPDAPDIAAQEAGVEATWNALLAHPDSEPEETIQLFGILSMSEVMLRRARDLATGAQPEAPFDPAGLQQELLSKWRRLAPSASGPDVLPLLQIDDLGEKQRRVLALLDHHPGDVLLTWYASQTLRHAGEGEHAIALLEELIARRPDESVGYRLLAQSHTSAQNTTRLLETLVRWAQAAPGDPRLVAAWLTSPLPEQQPALTVRVVDSFLALDSTRPESLTACRLLAKSRNGSDADRGRACIARLAAGDSKLAPEAASELVQRAAADGDWDGFAAAVATLEPERRIAAITTAGHRLPAPAQCEDRVSLVRLALHRFQAGSAVASLSSVLAACSSLPAAVELFLELLRRSPAEEASPMLTAWVGKANGRPVGPLPVEAAAAALEARLAEDEKVGIFRALDRVYEFGELDEQRLALLQRWEREDRDSFSAEAATSLAELLEERGDVAAAAGLLERQLAVAPGSQAAEALWALYVASDRVDDAVRLALRLIEGDHAGLAATGHVLSARSAVIKEDAAEAERQYRLAITLSPARKWAAELLGFLAFSGRAGQVEETARELCATPLLQLFRDPQACVGDLLSEADTPEALASFVSVQARDLPSDSGQLLEMAQRAREAGRPEVAERALRRLREIDPLARGVTIQLAGVLEAQAKVDELEQLLAEARREAHPEVSRILRNVGRAQTMNGDPRRGIDLLREARAGLPEGADPAWIDKDLREGYAALARTAPRVATPDASLPALPLAPAAGVAIAAARPAPTPSEAEALLLRAEALRSGSGGAYDPDAARGLFEEAAGLGDARARFALALQMVLSNPVAPIDRQRSSRLYAVSAAAVGKLALAGDADAAYLVGTAFLVGLGVAVDPEAARRWLEPAAAAGQTWAVHNLAWMRETGSGFDHPDPAGALEGYRKAARGGNLYSALAFAERALRDSRGAICEEGLAWLERSARGGNRDAAALLGKVLYYGRGDCVASAPEKALPWLESAVARGAPGASFDLAMAVAAGDAGTADPERALELFDEGGAGKENALTLETLAFFAATGVGTPRDPARARRLLAQAAALGSDGLPEFLREVAGNEHGVFRRLFDRGVEIVTNLAAQGDVSAEAFLADLHFSGFSPIADNAKAISLARAAAAGGDPAAMRILGQAYRDGRGVAQDGEQAAEWFRRGAERGNSFCMMFLAYMLLDGDGVDADPEAGLAWLTKAGEAGNWWAVLDLGRLYSEGGEGRPPDDVEAEAWRRRSARRGSEEARGWLLYRGLSVDG